MTSGGFRKIEADLIPQFTGELQRRFLELYGQGEVSASVVGSALGGQDAELADYLLAANARFSLIEFKANEGCIISEKDKDLRLKLCQALSIDTAKRARARDIHYVAWGDLIPL